MKARPVKGTRRLHQIILSDDGNFGYTSPSESYPETELDLISMNPFIYLELPDQDIN